MAAFSRPLTIRQANIDDFINMGKRLHGARRSQIYNTLYGTADPDFWQQRYWMDSAGGGVGKGQHNVLFLERADTKEIIGLAWFWRIDRECEPIHSGWSSKGFCNDEAWKVTLPQFFWQRELMATRHQYICELGYRTRSEIVDLPPVDPESPVSLTDLQEFAISPAYRNRGLEKVLLGHIIALAEENRLDLALTVAQEKSGFFFQEGWTFVHSERISSRCRQNGLGILDSRYRFRLGCVEKCFGKHQEAGLGELKRFKEGRAGEQVLLSCVISVLHEDWKVQGRKSWQSFLGIVVS